MTNLSVKLLTFSFFLLSSCSFVDDQLGFDVGERLHSDIQYWCKNDAHIATNVEDFISSRFKNGSPVRIGIMPFSSPAISSPFNPPRPDLGETITWQLQQALAKKELSAIVEVFNRPAMPGLKDEFFTGNFGAIDLARKAGYDMVILGYIDSPRSTTDITAHTKLIEVEAGMTVWYGTSTASSREKRVNRIYDNYLGSGEVPSEMYVNELMSQLPLCIAKGIREAE